MKRLLSGWILNAMRLLKNQFLSFETYYRIQSLRTSYEFAVANFKTEPRQSREDILTFLPRPESGDIILEFGVYKGESITLLAGLFPQTRIHGFDSFEGLPTAWGMLAGKGHFDVKGRLPRVPDNVSLHKGWFKDTLPGFISNILQEGTSRILLVHIDCDIYESTRDIFDLLSDRLVGTYILFDEYFGYPGWEYHEHRAFREWVEARSVSSEYLAYTSKGKVLAKITN